MSTVYSLQSTVYSLQSTVYSLQSTVYSLQSTVYSLQSTVCLCYHIPMWEFKRKLLYALSFFVILCGLAVFFARGILFPAPTCFDGKHNGFEANVDCGGECQIMCQQDVSPLSIVWAKAIASGKDVYDLVALVTNSNIDNASRELGYSFDVYDASGSIMKTFRASTTAPLDGKFPLIIQGVTLPSAPVNTVATLSDTLHYKVNESPTSPTIRILARRYEAGQIPRVYVTVANTKRIEIRDLPVRVLLFDNNDNVYAVGQTVIPELLKEGVKEIIITWNEPLPVAPTRIGVYPIFNPFEALPNY